MVLFAGLGDVDNQAFGKEERTDRDEERYDPNGFSFDHFSTMTILLKKVYPFYWKCVGSHDPMRKVDDLGTGVCNKRGKQRLSCDDYCPSQ
jgi:hypothetical protein